MKNLLTILIATAVALFSSCSKANTSDSNIPVNDKIVYVGICPSGIGSTALGYYRSTLKSMGATLIVNDSYCFTETDAAKYVAKVDAVIAPGSTSGDDDNRSTSDNNIIKAAIDAGKPVLGICYGHQRLNVVLGGTNTTVAKLAPESTVEHRKMNGSTNVGIRSEIHSITIDTSSRLYNLLGEATVMVNSSHTYAISKLSAKLKVVATSEDGIIEAVEGDNVMGVQFHPEYLYGEMKIARFKAIFQDLVDKAYKIKYPEN